MGGRSGWGLYAGRGPVSGDAADRRLEDKADDCRVLRDADARYLAFDDRRPRVSAFRTEFFRGGCAASGCYNAVILHPVQLRSEAEVEDGFTQLSQLSAWDAMLRIAIWQPGR